MKNKFSASLLLLLTLVNHSFFAQTKVNGIFIGTQVWASENLNVNTFRNGDAIPEAKTDQEWKKYNKAKMPAWCYFLNDSKNGKIYGKLYNWYAVNDKRGLAPKGWHIPSDNEWDLMIKHLGGEVKVVSKIRSKSGWNDNCNATNSSGFSALSSGMRMSDGYFPKVPQINIGSFWWTSTPLDETGIWFYSIGGHCDSPNMPIQKQTNDQGNGYSIRCIKDK